MANMDPTAITGMLTSVGFPIVAAYMMWVFTKSRIEATEKATQVREEATAKVVERRDSAAEIREGKLVERINHLEDSIRTELVTAVNQSKDVMNEAKDAIAYCSGTLSACTVALNDMRDTAKREADKRAAAEKMAAEAR